MRGLHCCREGAQGDERQGDQYLAPAKDCSCFADGYVLRAAYDHARANYVDSVHTDGARVGKPWSAGHQHQAAIRYAGKRFLDLLFDAAQEASA